MEDFDDLVVRAVGMGFIAMVAFSRETYLKLANSMGQSLQSMANGLEAVAHALENFRGGV